MHNVVNDLKNYRIGISSLTNLSLSLSLSSIPIPDWTVVALRHYDNETAVNAFKQRAEDGRVDDRGSHSVLLCSGLKRQVVLKSKNNRG